MFYSPRVSTISICNPIHVHEAIHTSWSYMNQHNVMQLLAYKAQSMQLQYVCNVKMQCNMSKHSPYNSFRVVKNFSCHFLNTLTYNILMQNHMKITSLNSHYIKLKISPQHNCTKTVLKPIFQKQDSLIFHFKNA